jgi:hypothetical protein
MTTADASSLNDDAQMGAMKINDDGGRVTPNDNDDGADEDEVTIDIDNENKRLNNGIIVDSSGQCHHDDGRDAVANRALSSSLPGIAAPC